MRFQVIFIDDERNLSRFFFLFFYQTVSVGIKWPNDIYVGDKIKIGGLIVNSSFSNGVFNAIIGMTFLIIKFLHISHYTSLMFSRHYDFMCSETRSQVFSSPRRFRCKQTSLYSNPVKFRFCPFSFYLFLY